MAYADQQMSGSKIVAIVIVALIHIALGYALVTGLAYSAVKKAIERVTTVDIKEPEPEKKPPPPPPEKQPDTTPPPVVAPPPPINIAPAPPPIQTQPTIPPPAPPVLRVPPPAPVAPPPPPAPPPPKFQPKPPVARGNPSSWANSNDYPSRALREEREGVTGFTVQIDANGRVSSCTVTRSSGSPDLDDTTCKLISRRARFKPATDGNGDPVASSWSNKVSWVIPK